MARIADARLLIIAAFFTTGATIDEEAAMPAPISWPETVIKAAFEPPPSANAWSPSALMDTAWATTPLKQGLEQAQGQFKQGLEQAQGQLTKLKDEALYNLDKLANITIDDFNEGDRVPVVRKEEADRPRRTHHKLVVLFFVVSITFLVGVICMTGVFYSREKLSHDTANYGSFGLAKQHKAGLFSAMRGKTQREEGASRLDSTAAPRNAPNTLYKQALLPHGPGVVKGASPAPRRKSSAKPLPSIDERDAIGYTNSEVGSDVETQSLSSQAGFFVPATEADGRTRTQRGFPQPRQQSHDYLVRHPASTVLVPP